MSEREVRELLHGLGVRPRRFTLAQIHRLMRDALSVVDDPDPNQDPHVALCLVILQLLTRAPVS